MKTESAGIARTGLGLGLVERVDPIGQLSEEMDGTPTRRTMAVFVLALTLGSWLGLGP
jgi:hypothetical protein